MSEMRSCVCCARSDGTSRHVSLHQFPKDEAVLSIWLQNIGFDTKWRPLRNHYLCSKHFLSKCLVGKRLKKGSIPTIFDNRIENNVSYDKFKIKNEEIDIKDELAINKEFNINSDPDIKSIELTVSHDIVKVENEEVNVTDEDEINEDHDIRDWSIKNTETNLQINNEGVDKSGKFEINGEYSIKSDWNIKSREVSEHYDVIIKEEGDKFEIIGEYKIMSDWDVRSGKDSGIYEVTVKKEVDVNEEFDVNVENVSDKEGAEANESKPLCLSTTLVTREASSDNQNYAVRYNIKSSKFICDICNNRYANKKSLSEHIIAKHTQHPYPTQPTSLLSPCPYCNKSYQKKYLSNHINAIHTKATTYKCPHCSYTAYYQSTVMVHVNAKHTQRKMFSCSFCEYRSYRKFHLDRHLNAHHTKGSSYVCPYCKHVAYCKYTLDKHINAKHTKSVSFSCTHCTFKTYQKENLVRHVNAKHTQSTYFICDHCNYKTFVKNDLSKHISSLHTRSVRYNCSYCRFETFDPTRLRNHVVSKHNRALQCTELTKTVTFKRHVKTQHS